MAATEPSSGKRSHRIPVGLIMALAGAALIAGGIIYGSVTLGSLGADVKTRTRNITPEQAICSGMSDFRETIIYQWLAAGDAGELDAFDDLLLSDAVVHAPRGLSTTSREAEKAVWRDALVAMPDLCHDVQEVVVGHDVEMARVLVTGTMARAFAGVEGTGRSFHMDQAVIVHLRDGRIEEAWEIADVVALERQMTGSEQSDTK